MKNRLFNSITLLIGFLALLLTAATFIPGGNIAMKQHLFKIITYLILFLAGLLAVVIGVVLVKNAVRLFEPFFDKEKNDKEKEEKTVLLFFYTLIIIAFIVITLLILNSLYNKGIELCVQM
jgi:quinol-cytochrome oxidoreductase complex cytochrome b subunit